MTTQVQVKAWRPAYEAITCLAYSNEVPEGQACPCGCGVVQALGHRDAKPRN